MKHIRLSNIKSTPVNMFVSAIISPLKNRPASVYAGFDALQESGPETLAAAFSADGTLLYVSKGSEQVVWATDSSGTEEPVWSVEVPDSALCDMAVSPDGLSVRASLFPPSHPTFLSYFFSPTSLAIDFGPSSDRQVGISQ